MQDQVYQIIGVRFNCWGRITKVVPTWILAQVFNKMPVFEMRNLTENHLGEIPGELC